MSADDGSRGATPDVENTLLAALGFEPTNGADDGASLLVEEGTADALHWAGDEPVSATNDSTVDHQLEVGQADGIGITGSASPTTTAKATDAMTPPKGKGKGPRTYRSSRSRPTAKPPPKPPASNALDKNGPAGDGDDSTLAIGLGSKQQADKALLGKDRNGANGQTDVDPADLIDAGEPGDYTLLSEQELANLAPPGRSAPDATAPIPAGRFPGGGSERGAHSTDPPPPTVDDEIDALRSSSPDTIVVDGLTLETSPPSPPPPSEADGLFDDAAELPMEPIISDSPPVVPPAEVTAPHAAAPPAAPPTLIPEVPVIDPDVPMVESVPVVSPPPPVITDPGEETNPDPIGAVEAAAAASATVAARSGISSPGFGGDIAVKVPQLLDQGLLKRTRRVRARKVRRVIRHIDPWSVLTFSVLFFLCLFAAMLLASVLVWNAAVAAGTIENIENFIREIGDYQTYKINGDVVFRAAMVIAGILTLAASVMLVLLVVVFNLISDLVGGIRVTVVEEETVRVRRRNQ